MQVTVRLPHHPEHVAQDRAIPDGVGLPVRFNYAGEPIGRVQDWTDNGDGTVTAVLELEPPENLAELLESDDLRYGLDARVQVDGSTVTSISKLTGVGIWVKGTLCKGEPPQLCD